MSLPYVCGVGEEGFRENASFKPALAGYVAAGAAVARKMTKTRKAKRKRKLIGTALRRNPKMETRRGSRSEVSSLK
jgi:hypothetical protein